MDLVPFTDMGFLFLLCTGRVWFPEVGWRGGGVDRRWNKVLPPFLHRLKGVKLSMAVGGGCVFSFSGVCLWLFLLLMIGCSFNVSDVVRRDFNHWLLRRYKSFPFIDSGGRCFGTSVAHNFELVTGRTEMSPELEGFCTLVLVLLCISFLVWGVMYKALGCTVLAF
jgi:hypothetical protein